jgi:hypothetical protein
MRDRRRLREDHHRHALLLARCRHVSLRRLRMNVLWFLGLLTIGAVLAPLIFSLFMMPLFGLLWLASRLPDSFTQTRAFGYLVGGALFIVQAVYWALWAAWCSSTAAGYAQSHSIFGWLYYVIAFVFCAAPIQWLAGKETAASPTLQEKSDVLRGASRYRIVALLAFVVFSLWPASRRFLYGWALG